MPAVPSVVVPPLPPLAAGVAPAVPPLPAVTGPVPAPDGSAPLPAVPKIGGVFMPEFVPLVLLLQPLAAASSSNVACPSAREDEA